MGKEQPHWQPISMLPTFSDTVDGMLKASSEQLDTLRLVLDKPHVLDDATLNRVIAHYSEQLDDHWLFEAQFDRWKCADLRQCEEEEVDRLIRQSSTLQALNEEILKLAHSIEHATIDKILAMDDIDVGMAILSGELHRPDH